MRIENGQSGLRRDHPGPPFQMDRTIRNPPGKSVHERVADLGPHIAAMVAQVPRQGANSGAKMRRAFQGIFGQTRANRGIAFHNFR